MTHLTNLQRDMLHVKDLDLTDLNWGTAGTRDLTISAGVDTTVYSDVASARVSRDNPSTSAGQWAGIGCLLTARY